MSEPLEVHVIQQTLEVYVDHQMLELANPVVNVLEVHSPGYGTGTSAEDYDPGDLAALFLSS